VKISRLKDTVFFKQGGIRCKIGFRDVADFAKRRCQMDSVVVKFSSVAK
jgi:hypothetical protein